MSFSFFGGLRQDSQVISTAGVYSVKEACFQGKTIDG
jgi:hypothetical protein